MARSRPSLEKMSSLVATIEDDVAADVPLKEALAEASISQATFYRYRDLVNAGVWPAVHRDWSDLARTWNHGGDLPELDEAGLFRLRHRNTPHLG